MASADTGQKCFTYCFVSFQYEIRQECMKIKYISRVKKSNALNPFQTHIYTERSPTQQHPSNKQTLTTVYNLVSTKACPVPRLHWPAVSSL